MDNQGPSDRGFSGIVILHHDRCIRAGAKPPVAVSQALSRIYPMVRLEWHPVLKLWTLWEKIGREGHFIAALADENGDYAHPNMRNTIALLDRIRSPTGSSYDRRKWLEDVDSDPQWVGEMEKRGEDLINQGSMEMDKMGRGRTLMPVPKYTKLPRRAK